MDGNKHQTEENLSKKLIEHIAAIGAEEIIMQNTTDEEKKLLLNIPRGRKTKVVMAICALALTRVKNKI